MGSSATLADAGSSMTHRSTISNNLALTNLFVNTRKASFYSAIPGSQPVPRRVAVTYRLCFTSVSDRRFLAESGFLVPRLEFRP